MLAWITANWGMVATTLWGICEVLALIPGIKSNSIFTLIFNTLQGLVGGKTPPAQLP